MGSKKTGKQEKKSGLAGFFRGVKKEFAKIIWPDRYTMVKQLVAVAAVTAVSALLIAVIDFGSQNLINWILQLSF